MESMEVDQTSRFIKIYQDLSDIDKIEWTHKIQQFRSSLYYQQQQARVVFEMR